MSRCNTHLPLQNDCDNHMHSRLGHKVLKQSHLFFERGEVSVASGCHLISLTFTENLSLVLLRANALFFLFFFLCCCRVCITLFPNPTAHKFSKWFRDGNMINKCFYSPKNLVIRWLCAQSFRCCLPCSLSIWCNLLLSFASPGDEWCYPTAGVCGRVCHPVPDVWRLPPCGGQRLLEGRRSSQAEGSLWSNVMYTQIFIFQFWLSAVLLYLNWTHMLTL